MKKAILILAAISLFGCKEHYPRQSFVHTVWKTKDGKQSLSFSDNNVNICQKSDSIAIGSIGPVKFTEQDGFNEFIIDGYKPGMATSDTTLNFNNETYIKVTHKRLENLILKI